jgi:hypothetical protein
MLIPFGSTAVIEPDQKSSDSQIFSPKEQRLKSQSLEIKPKTNKPE